MPTLIVDFSPVFYRFVFSATTEYAKKHKKDENGLYNFDEYKDIILYNILDYISKFKQRFNTTDIIIAFDHGKYWREIGTGVEGEFTGYSRYKYGRHKEDKSGIDWIKAKKTQNEILEILKKSSFKTIDIPGIEGDDILMVLSEYISPNEVIIKSLDHDLEACLLFENVKYWQTKHSTKTKDCSYIEKSKEEIEKIKFNHVLFGDPGDGFLHCKAWTRFSPEFKEKYPDLTELKVWPKHHEIDLKFQEKYGVSAYKHPRFGPKMFEKSGQSLENFLKENPIHKLNYNLNKQLALPEMIPDSIRQKIIKEYENQKNKSPNYGELIKELTNKRLFELVGNVSLL